MLFGLVMILLGGCLLGLAAVRTAVSAPPANPWLPGGPVYVVMGDRFLAGFASSGEPVLTSQHRQAWVFSSSTKAGPALALVEAAGPFYAGARLAPCVPDELDVVIDA